MSDLISKSELIRDLDEKIEISKAERAAAIKRGSYNDVYFYSGEICIARRIKRYANIFAPTVDAEPVVHARWITVQGFWCCSICGCSPADWECKPNNPYGLPPYCHCCGAKMDGGTSDGKE